MLTIEGQKGDTEVMSPSVRPHLGTARQEVPVFQTVPGNDAYRLRKALEAARQALATKQIDAADPLHRQLELAERERQQFWIDTCRDPREARAVSRQVAELHRQHGWRFLTPSPCQVRSILEALDSAMPDWEQNHPALFFQTLELNFPGVLRLLARP